ncbi:hypothetical protein LCGC14_1070100 [marine sediment metagenome]|uniref:Uncharacterized protein n=1 Tax=marine sediment metagenome TaxID=412755 RepID=A0A0F9MIK1_9ZZZZ
MNDSQLWEISTTLPVRFGIFITPNVFSYFNKKILEHGNVGPGARRLVILDRNIVGEYGDAIKRYFSFHKIEAEFLILDCHESTKDLESTLKIVDALEEFHVARRSEPVIAVGGGVLLDMVGFAASIYRRGIPYIRVPTTLIGLVDASLAAKTGINYKVRRNRLGSYYPPLASYLDRVFLKTLEKKHISSGLGEILKMAVVKDSQLFDLLERHGSELLESNFDHPFANEIIARSITGMIEELEPNLWEKDLRRLVDFGHSFSPIIEMKSIHEGYGPALEHGEAVTLDVLYSCIISCLRGSLPRNDLLRIFRVSKSMGLPTNHPLFNDPDVLELALADTMKHRDNAQNLPMPIRIGESGFLNTLTRDEIERAARHLENIQGEI